MNSRGEGRVTVTSNRGQSAVLSLVILIGMVATVSVGILVVAGDVMSSAEQQSEHNRVEQAFVELSHTMSTVSASDDTPRSVQFDAGESGAVTKTKAGWVTIRGGGVNITRQPMGAIEYEGDDGTIISYQSGGVWRETGNQTRMLSAPNIDYDSEDDTLWFPITTLSGQQSLDSGEISVRHKDTNPMRHVSFVRNDSVTITIQSDYYRGWERYFRTAAGGTSIQNVDHENRTITVLLGYADLEGAFDEGATIGSDDSDDFQDKHDNFGSHRTGTPLPEMDTVIEQMITDAKAGDNIDKNLSNGSYSNPLDTGTYFVEEINGNEDYEFNLTNGNTTLIVENNVNLGSDGSINVSDQDAAGENVLRIYAGGNKTVIDGDICAGSCGDDAKVIQFYGPSTMSVDLGPSSKGTFEGVLYVSSTEEKDWWDSSNGGKGSCKAHHQVHLQANGNFYGSIVAYSACAQSKSVSFDHDPTLKNANIDPYSDEYPLPPQITYLNVAVHELDVQNK